MCFSYGTYNVLTTIFAFRGLLVQLALMTYRFLAPLCLKLLVVFLAVLVV